MALRDQPQTLWTDPVVAHQMETYATNAARADLAKQENMYRIAELGLRKQQAEQTNQLNRLLTANQLQQQDLDNRYRDRALSQQLEIAKLPRYTSEIDRQAYDKTLRQEEDLREANLASQLEASLADIDKQISTASPLEKAPKNLESPSLSMGDLARIAINPVLAMSQFDYSGQRDVTDYLRKQYQREPTEQEVSKFIKDTKTYRASPDTARLPALQQRKLALLSQLTQYGWIYDPATKKIIRPNKPSVTVPPTASSLTTPGGQPTLDEVKREAAAAIQGGANPADVYKRLADLGFDIR